MTARIRNLVALTAIAAMTRDRSPRAEEIRSRRQSDTEIKIGNIMPYSGPASAYGTIGKAQAAYFNKINAEGGINGRKINFISYDDAYQPAEGRRAGAQAGGERRGACWSSSRSARRRTRRSRNT